jgi:hypothetical protein
MMTAATRYPGAAFEFFPANLQACAIALSRTTFSSLTIPLKTRSWIDSTGIPIEKPCYKLLNGLSSRALHRGDSPFMVCDALSGLLIISNAY